MPLPRLVAGLLAASLCPVALACSDDPADTATATTSVATTLPVEFAVTEDLVLVGLDGIYSVEGAALVTFTPDERACVAGAAAETPGLAAVTPVPPGTFDDPDMEQAVAEIVVACVPLERVGVVVVEQLVPQLALEGVDRACIEREVDTLAEAPSELAALLSGDPNGITATALVVAENCAP